MIHKKLARRLCLLLAAVALIVGQSVAAAARDGPAGIYLRYSQDDRPLAGKAFDLYRVGDLDGALDLSWTEEYAGYGLALDPSDAAATQALPATLSSYIDRDGREPMASGDTDATGRLSFEGLPDGLYLLRGRAWSSGNSRYYPAPALVSIPYTGEGNMLSRQASLEIKHDVRTSSPGRPTPPSPPSGGDPPPDTVIEDPGTPTDSTPKADFTVVKKWAGSGDIPASVSVDLILDGELAGTVELSAANGWTYTWRDLPMSSSFDAVETSVPEGFVLKTDRDGDTRTLVNEFAKEDTDPEPPSDTTEITGPDVPQGLPQTGMLQWPVALLCGAGAVLSLAGCACIRAGRKEE